MLQLHLTSTLLSVAEIGERGKAKLTTNRVSEGVPPAPAPAPAAAPAVAPAVAPALQSGLMTSSTPELGLSPSMQVAPLHQRQQHQQQQISGASETGFADLSTFMEKQQAWVTLLLERDEKAKQELKVERAEMRAEMDKQRAEMDAKIAELTPAPPQEVVSTEQLAALQVRFERLHAAKQLTDDELFACEGE